MFCEKRSIFAFREFDDKSDLDSFPGKSVQVSGLPTALQKGNIVIYDLSGYVIEICANKAEFAKRYSIVVNYP